MRLLLINYEYPPIGGGAATATQALARCFTRIGHRVTILTSGIGDCVGEQEEDEIRIIRLRTGRARMDRSSMTDKLSFLCRAFLALPRIYRVHRPDRAIVFFSVPCGPLGWFLRAWYKVPYIISLRGGDVPGFLPELDRFHRLLGLIRRQCLRRAHAVVANSPSLAKLALEADGGPVSMIPNGVDTTLFAPRGETSRRDTFRFLFVGRLTRQKRLALTLEAFKHLYEDNVGGKRLRLSVVGDGPLRAELERKARRLGIADCVEWHGWIDRDRLRDLYQDADCLLHTSNIEGMSNTVLEAMASGLPVISSDGPGNLEVVTHCENGLLFHVDNEEDLFHAMTALKSDPELIKRLGRVSRDRALSQYSWMASAHAYLELLEAHAHP